MANQQLSTSTQIRNMYSEGMSYLNISFFNTKLAFRFFPFMNKDQNGRSTYDMRHGQNTTVDYEGAAALYLIAKGIIDGNIQETNLPIPCANGASLAFERKMGMDGRMETIFTITKNNVSIPYKFNTIQCQVKINGQITTKTIESGLQVFVDILNGYLGGINSDRHLDKFTEDYVKSLGENGNVNNQQNQQPQQQNNQPRQNNYNNNYNNNGGYKRYNNNNNRGGYKRYNNNNNGNWQPPVQQNLSSYNIQD